MNSPDCLILGDGLAGLSLARELRLRGSRVIVIGRPTQHASASWAAGGILSPLEPWHEPAPILQLARLGQQLYPDLLAELAVAGGIDAEYRVTGMLCLEPLDHAAIDNWLQHCDREYHLLNGAGVAGREPALAPQAGALWLPDVAQVRNPRLLQALRSALQQQGVVLHEVSEPPRLLFENARCVGIRAGGARLSADQVVLAAGAWSSQLLQGHGPAPPVRPVRGQMLAFQTGPDALQSIVLRERQYLIPRRDGLILAGSTLEEAGFDAVTTEAAASDLHAMAAGLMPALARLDPVQHWSGLRPATPDGMPYVGAHPTLAGLYLNYGHFRNGILLAPASARLLADQMAGEKADSLGASFDPSRQLPDTIK